ncbi:MAG: hypothetical protein R6X09_12305 [Bacteroidales bacterium]
MNTKKLLLQLLPGFIPLIVFILADEIWGTRIGLLVAIGFGIAGLVWYLLKDRRFDRFILFDTLLIVALGVVSIPQEPENHVLAFCGLYPARILFGVVYE